MAAMAALIALLALAAIAIGLLTTSGRHRAAAAQAHSGAEALFVAEGGVQQVIRVLKTGASTSVRDHYPVTREFLATAAAWGLTPAAFPGGFQAENLRDGQFIPGDPRSAVEVTVPGIGRGTATVRVWLKAIHVGEGMHPVVFGVDGTGALPDGGSRRIVAEVILRPVGGRPPNPIQAGGLNAPVLAPLAGGATAIAGTVLDPGARVTILRRAGNNWEVVGATEAAAGPAGGPYAFSLATNPLAAGETYSAQHVMSGGAAGAYAFPVAAR
jgi:hypothetical protein